MTEYIKQPNLPDKKVKTVIAGNMPDSVRNAITDCGINILSIKSNRLLSKPVKSHADLQCIHLGDNRILLNTEQKELNTKLLKIGLSISYFSFSSGKYPDDCSVNAAFVGRKVICNYAILNADLKRFITNNNYTVINVNQGYTKCSVCVVDNNSVITEDESIKNACINSNIDVLLISKGFVELEGYDYGFIGGASFKSDKDTLCFIGKVENHPDFNRIKDFIYNKNIKYFSLGEEKLTDIGSVLPIVQ